jgi:16S rRNA (guanine527-N7)-methyltransferase
MAMREQISVDLPARAVAACLAPFKIAPSDDQISKIREYVALLLRWNRSISLTTVTDPKEIVARHFGESMYAANLLHVKKCRLADVGTGAGFPGLALKIACPSLQLLLIESNRKKCAFLSEVTRALRLEDVEIQPERFEEIRPETVRADIVTCRAVGEFKQMLRWSRVALAPHGHLVLWLGSDDATRIARAEGWTWQPAQRIPESQRRFILIGRLTEESASGG